VLRYEGRYIHESQRDTALVDTFDVVRGPSMVLSITYNAKVLWTDEMVFGMHG
jgi:hypothetical protein